jgi:hypothetical protein
MKKIILTILAIILLSSMVFAQLSDVYYITLSVKDGKATVISKELGKDYPRQYTGDYSYDILDGNGAVLKSASLDIPEAIAYEKFSEDGSIDGEAQPVNDNIVIVIPASEGAKSVVLKNQSGAEIASVEVPSSSQLVEKNPGFFMRNEWLLLIILVLVIIIAVIIGIIVLIRKLFRKRKNS